MGTIISRLVGGAAVADDGLMERKTITLDNQVAEYIQERFLRESREADEAKNKEGAAGKNRVTLTGLLRTALERPLDSETASAGKAVLAARHRQHGSWRTNLEISESTMNAIRVEKNRYSSRKNMLTEAAIIELRIAAWAVVQPDWVGDAQEQA